MKKLFSIILTLLMLIGILASCGSYESPDENPANTGSNGETTGGGNSNLENDKDNESTVPPIEVEYDEEREANDSEFPFDNIVIERNGYDLVAGGRYYGNDFDNVKYYGSYYRIIDNYSDFSELTQWGNDIDESTFNDNFVLVLYSYKNHYLYNSVRSEKGTFSTLKIETNSIKLSLIEEWVVDGRAEIVDGETIISQTKWKENEILFPIDVHEILYLLIPKNELPNELPINGEINVKTLIRELE